MEGFVVCTMSSANEAAAHEKRIHDGTSWILNLLQSEGVIELGSHGVGAGLAVALCTAEFGLHS